MTKQYAETGTNEECSQVCARLPLQIQLFAEEPGAAGADTNKRGQRSAPAPVSVIEAMVKRAADCILVLAKRSFPMPG